MTLTCETVADPTYYVPKAMVACVATLFVSAICILFAVASVPPGMHSVLDSMLPLNSGYEKSWNISSRAATILALPGTFSTAFGFMFAYGKQIFAMSRSQLLPHFLSETYGPHQTPVSALLFGSLFGLCVLLILSYTFPSFSRELFSICMLGSCSVYVSIFRSYLVCADRYSNLERQFVSPLGRIGAIYGIIVFSVMVVSLAFFQDDGFLSIIVFTIFLLISLLYYFAVVRKREFFSDEEQRNFWKAYLLNATYNRRQNKGGDGLLRIWPGAGAWAANSPTALGPFPLPSGRLPSKQDPKVNPAADGREALRAPSGDSFAPSDPSSVLGRSEHKENGYVSLPGARDRSILTPYSVARRSASSPPAVKEGDRGDYLLALRFDWGDQRILLTETTTECLFRSSS